MIKTRASPDFEEHNRHMFSRKNVVGSYTVDGLLPAEEHLFALHRDKIAGKRVLDIGVGGGRTTAALLELSADYVAVDYSEGCVEVVKQRFGLDRVYCADARDMAIVASEAFDFAFFSFNGIDYVDHDGRARILREVHRVLAPGGVFLFSSHNRDAHGAGLLPWQRRWSPSLGFAKACARAVLFTPRRRRAAEREIRMPDYALLNDEAHNYALVTYYIGRHAQVHQLEAAGFRDVTAYDEGGAELTGAEMTESEAASRWLYYSAHR